MIRGVLWDWHRVAPLRSGGRAVATGDAVLALLVPAQLHLVLQHTRQSLQGSQLSRGGWLVQGVLWDTHRAAVVGSGGRVVATDGVLAGRRHLLGPDWCVSMLAMQQYKVMIPHEPCLAPKGVSGITRPCNSNNHSYSNILCGVSHQRQGSM
jgi:hypothetical protein